MTKTPSKPKSKVVEKPRRVKAEFKPDIRLATAIVSAIAFLQKAGLHATPKIIKRCINERSRKRSMKNIEHLSRYLNRGLELGILKIWRGSYKLGDFQIRKRTARKKKVEKVPQKSSEKVELIKDADVRSEKSSVCDSICGKKKAEKVSEKSSEKVEVMKDADVRSEKCSVSAF